jgi:hypothetical protein
VSLSSHIMADLDDFFAKKDKKKAGKKKKTPAVTSVQLFDQLKEDAGPDSDTETNKPSVQISDIARQDDSEWVQINEDLTDGLSDLKIKSLDADLKLEEEEAQRLAELQRQAEAAKEEDEFSGDANKGPWAAIPSGTAVNTNKTNTQNNAPHIPSGLVSSGGTYIPPSKRGPGTTAPAPVNRRKEKIDVNSQDQFPELKAASKEKSREKHDPSFDTVKSGGRKAQNQNRSEEMVLTNKFSTLQS